jgi:hypothetical protein
MMMHGLANVKPLRTVPDLCKNVSLAVLFGSNGSSYTISTQSYTCVCVCECVCVYVYFSQYRDAGRAKEIKKKPGTAVNAACRFGHACHRFVSHVETKRRNPVLKDNLAHILK